ncbi:hypothetical protein [Streptomyces sp. NPDC013457]|uniref:hypothetical protein n=1 Tax=Streptomyces sp. NPDC013457 TaxID=3364866 RepID=UPI0036F75F47
MSASPKEQAAPADLSALLRHFADLRDGVHGDNAYSRESKEQLFVAAVSLLGPFARQALEEMNAQLLLSAGEITGGQARRTRDGSLIAVWALTWAQQREAGLAPVSLQAYYGADFHHPHLRGATVGEWPLNVFTPEQAARELPTLRAIASADLHNLVFQRNYGIVPATVERDDGIGVQKV